MPREKRAISAALTLSEFFETGYIQKRTKVRYLEGEIGGLVQQYIQFKHPERLDSVTIHQIERNLSRLNLWLASTDIHDIDHLKQYDVVRFIQGLDSRKKGCIHLMLMHLKGFFRYLYNTKLIPTNITAAIPTDNYRNQAKLPSYLFRK
ncbi:site-specific integrase [Arcticibacter svalbardensis]|nr:site-specific integrase [Arcticibacter svalbardensis]